MRFFMLLSLASLVACGSGERKAQSNSTPDASNSMARSGVSERSEPPAPAAPPPPIKVTMPDFAPQYPGSTIQATNSGTTGASNNHEVHLMTRDGAEKIVEFYRAKFAAAGLQKTSEFLSGGTGMMSAMGKGRIASIAITKERDGNVIIVTYSGD